jgi:hypothetical protein
MGPNRSSLLLFAFMALITVSCEAPQVVEPPAIPPPPEIHGRIFDWRFGDSMSVTASVTLNGSSIPYSLASAAVRSDGTFQLSLPHPPPNTFWHPQSPFDTLSDSTARVVVVYYLLLSNPDQSVQFVIKNISRPLPTIPSQGDLYLQRVYATKPVTWRTSYVVVTQEDTVAGDSHLNLGTGWNYVTVRHEARPRYQLSIGRVENIALDTWYITDELQPNQRLNLTELAESVNGRLKLLSRLGHL